MYRLLKCTKDAYITDRIINNSYRATDANVGHAGTLDLFKLYHESNITGSDAVELSRILVKFDLSSLHILTSSVLDLNDANFKATINLFNVNGGQPAPSNFYIVAHPVSKSWDEGLGRDIALFSDMDACNWITASVSNSPVSWSLPGANMSGVLGAEHIDIISEGDLLDGNGLVSLTAAQLFSTGDENLQIDVTRILSATLAGIIPDEGFRIAYSNANEQSDRTLFVKRFGSRHAINSWIQPRLIVQYNDSIQDNHHNFVFDTTGSLLLFNSVRGTPTNIISGAAATQLTGSNAMKLTLISGVIAPAISSSFRQQFDVDQFSFGSNYTPGVYKANFAISSYNVNLMREIQKAQSASFTAIWGSNDDTVAYKTGSLVIRSSTAENYIAGAKKYHVSVVNSRLAYTSNESPRVRVTVFDSLLENDTFFSRLPVKRVGKIINKMYWRVIDVYGGQVIIPFDTTNDSTRLSNDLNGMYFDFVPSDLSIGRVYSFEFMIVENGESMIFDQGLPTFRVMP